MAGERSPTPSPYLTASQVGEYVFCHRAWWLHHVRGHAPADSARLSRGRSAHATHGALVRWARILRRSAALFVLIALVWLLLRLVLG